MTARIGAAPGVARALAATMLAQAMVAMAVSAIPVLAPMPAAAYGVRASAVGFYSSLVFAGAIVCAPMGGAPVRRPGAVRCSRLALAAAGGWGLAFMAFAAFAALVGAELWRFRFTCVDDGRHRAVASTTCCR